MNHILTILLLLATFLNVQSQGIEFFEGTWEEALTEAEKAEKLIFVDAYATWCGPCKRMAKNVFPDPKLGDYMNQNFISLKIDMEKPKGRAFGKLFPVSAYPTLFFINEKGEMLKKVVGGKSIEQLLSLSQEIAGSYDRSGELAELYDQGNRDFDVVLKYVKALNNANKSSLKVANDYLREKKDLTAEQRAEFLYNALASADSRLFDLFIDNKTSIEEIYGLAKVEEKIEDACWRTIQTAIDFESEMLLDEAKLKMAQNMNHKANSFAFNAEYEFAKSQVDIARINKSALDIAQRIEKENPERLHDLCNELLQYQSIDDSVLESSERIAKMTIEKEATTEYLMTYSKILHSNNKNKKAIKQAKKALKVAETQVQKQMVESWLEQIESQ